MHKLIRSAINMLLQNRELIFPIEVPHQTFNSDGSFIMAKEFEDIFILENDYNSYSWTRRRPLNELDDNDYLDYKMWADMNYDHMMQKHFTRTVAFRGRNPNIIFHGGCLGCKSQRIHGIERCKGCSFFRANWRRLPNLKIEGEESATLTAEQLKNIFKNRNDE